MREIKIRMWNNVESSPEHSRYFYDPAEVMECLKQQMMFNAGVRGIAAYDHISDGNSFELFTGLKDKNGVEIYEGDILGSYPHGTAQVRWCKEYGCFESYSIEKEYDELGEYFEKEVTNLFANDLMNCKDSWIVIGNIHENPELLNQ